MLLRLLPSATPSQLTPPTILFTLPLPTHPYTARSLPLPPNLLAHRTICLHEDIECSNVLLGEKSSWVSGIIDDVTFSLPSSEIRVNFIDGTTTTLPLADTCASALQLVVEQVNLSFAPVPVPEPPRTPRTSSSSISSMSSISSSSSSSSLTSFRTPPQSVRRATSALLLTLLSPLLPSNTSQHFPPPLVQSVEPALQSRRHRRLARSLLVDTYRRFVLPTLKAALPQAYLPWAVSSEVNQCLTDFEQLRTEIDSLLERSGWDTARRSQLCSSSPSSLRRSYSASSSMSSRDERNDESSSSSSDDGTTPATSVFPSCPSSPIKSTHVRTSPSNTNASITPQAYLLTVPPAHDLAVSSSTRSQYSSYLARLTRIASRLSAVKRLDLQYNREEGKRRWLETLEKSRATERGLRRAWSSGFCKTAGGVAAGAGSNGYAKPARESRLWRSWTAEDEQNHQAKVLAREAATHPAMMDPDSEADSDLDEDADQEEDDEDAPGPVTPPASIIYSDRPITARQDLPLPPSSSLSRVSHPVNPACESAVHVHVAAAAADAEETRCDKVRKTRGYDAATVTALLSYQRSDTPVLNSVSKFDNESDDDAEVVANDIGSESDSDMDEQELSIPRSKHIESLPLKQFSQLESPFNPNWSLRDPSSYSSGTAAHNSALSGLAVASPCPLVVTHPRSGSTTSMNQVSKRPQLSPIITAV